MNKIFLAFALSIAIASPALASGKPDTYPRRGVNPSDFSWMGKSFEPGRYPWATGQFGVLSVPGMPITPNNAVYPKGWKVKPNKDGTFTVIPRNGAGKSGGGKGAGKKGR